MHWGEATVSDGRFSEEKELQSNSAKEFKILDLIERSGQKKRFLKENPYNIRRSLDRYFKMLEEGELPKRSMTRVVSDSILEYYNNEFNDHDVYGTLLSRLAKREDNSQGEISKFCGDYLLFTASQREDRGFSFRLLTIRREEEIYRWSIKRRIGDPTDRQYGFVFSYEDRLYLTGMGPNFTKPIIIEKPKQKKALSPEISDFLSGVTASITNNGEIFAAALVAVHETNSDYDDLSNWIWGHPESSAHEERVRAELANRATSENGVVIIRKP